MKKGRAIVGIILRRFRPDEDGGIQYLKMECLKYTPEVPTMLEKNLSHFDPEFDTIPAWDLVAGPVNVTPEVNASTVSIQKLISSKFLLPGYPKFLKAVSMIPKTNQEKEHERLFLN